MIKQQLKEKIRLWSLRRSAAENDLETLSAQLRTIVPDISQQESCEQIVYDEYWELKRRTLQAFQCRMMLRALENCDGGALTVVDIGDSAGTHMIYLRELTKDQFDIDTISVNLDARAVEKIRDKGLCAILCRAEELDVGKIVDLYTSFEMIEHLHNPAIFFRRLSVKGSCVRMVITVPYRRISRVGLHHVRSNSPQIIFAENEHIFELCPNDWSLLIRHSGWKVIFSSIYYQYPRRWPIISELLRRFWMRTDYEGFWGAILEKDTFFSDRYQDWEE